MAKKSRTQDTAADFARRSNAVSRMNRPRLPREERPALAGKDYSPRPMPRPSRGPEESMRPMMRPEGFAERAERQSVMGSDDAAFRASRREAEDVQKFAKGGKVNGFPDLNKDGKVTKADVLKGRGVEGFAMGGEVRGCSGSQMSGKGFSGSY